MQIDEIQIVVEIFMHVTYSFEIFPSQTLINRIKQMFLIELGTVNPCYLFFDLFILFHNDLILDPCDLLLCPLIHLHLRLPEAIHLPLLVIVECLVHLLQVVKHQLVEAEDAPAHEQIQLRAVVEDGGLLPTRAGRRELQVGEGGSQVGEGFVEEKVQIIYGTHVVQHI